MSAATQDEDRFAFEILGPLRARVNGREIELSVPMHRALVAILAINANSVVSTEHLIDELWGGAPAVGARATLQSYVSVVRRVFREAGRDGIIETRQPGYLLRVEGCDLDVTRFRALIASARQVGTGAGTEPYQELSEALGLIRGPILADLTHLDTVRVFTADIDEQRRWAMEKISEVDLEAGRASDVVPRLQQMVEDYPLEERMWGLLMRALYHSGRQGDALRCYQRLRELLLTELGLDPSPEIQTLESEILDGQLEAGAVRRPQRRRTVDAPHPTTPLVGRVAELNELDELLVGHRLVTITGPGGCGKTRLAAEAAQRRKTSHDQVAWVELNTVGDPTGVDEAVAAALGVIRRQPGGLLDAVADQMAEVSTLLIIDNCEHVIDRVALVTERLLSAAPRLTILTTSREQLMLAGEQLLNVPPLASASPLELTRATFEKPSEAATMFLERAGLLDRDGVYRSGPDELALVEAIAAQLDGIPLAIELAAPLSQSMTLDEIADRLLDRFLLLSDAHRGSRPQHRTLRAVVEWSYDLLDDEERAVFDALSVFRGPFSVEAATAVVDSVGQHGTTVLSRLVRKSVLLADTSGATTRYRMLETLRAFAAEQLSADPGALASVRKAFIDHYALQARRWSRHQQTATVTAWLAELGPDLANLQTAVAMARETDVDQALVFVNVFQWYFDILGQMAETREWLARLFDERDLSLEQRAIALVCQATLANFSGDYGATTALAEDALSAARELGDPKRLNAALIIRGTTATFEGNAERAAECFVESAPLSEALGDLGGIAASMAFWGIAHRRAGEFEDAKRCLDRAFEAFDRLGDLRGTALVVANLGRMAHQLGDVDRAADLTRRAMGLAIESLDPMVSAQAALFCGHLALDLGDTQQSYSDFETALHHSLILGNRTMSSAALEWMVLVGGGPPTDVAVIDAFTRARRNSPGTASPRPDWDAAVLNARRQLSGAELEELTEKGLAMNLEAAIAHARSVAAGAL